MSIPRWKRWLSYLVELELEHLRTDMHESLTVSLVRGRIQLFADRAIYSFEDLYSNFAEAFHRIDLSRLPGSRVLVLGLGLGSVIQLLEEQHDFQGDYTAIEQDEAIIYLARKYTIDTINRPITTITGDAEPFLLSYQGSSFDLVLLDIFQDDHIPEFFSTPTCLACIQRLLHSNGLLITNRLYRTPQDQVQTDQYVRHVFKTMFPHAAAMTVEGNRILFHDASYLKSS
ncbi:MAG: methionine biosynthesis protein MetW [Saprospiraceae bacterium]